MSLAFRANFADLDEVDAIVKNAVGRVIYQVEGHGTIKNLLLWTWRELFLSSISSTWRRSSLGGATCRTWVASTRKFNSKTGPLSLEIITMSENPSQLSKAVPGLVAFDSNAKALKNTIKSLKRSVKNDGYGGWEEQVCLIQPSCPSKDASDAFS